MVEQASDSKPALQEAIVKLFHDRRVSVADLRDAITGAWDEGDELAGLLLAIVALLDPEQQASLPPKTCHFGFDNEETGEVVRVECVVCEGPQHDPGSPVYDVEIECDLCEGLAWVPRYPDLPNYGGEVVERTASEASDHG